MGHDVFMNVAGGVRVDEPAVDLGIVCGIASSFLDRPIPDGTITVGEVGLTGEVRAVGQVETRIAESQKMGFNRCLIPENNLKRVNITKGMEMIGIKNVNQAIEVLF